MELNFVGNHIAAGEKNNFCICEDVSGGLKIHENWAKLLYHEHL